MCLLCMSVNITADTRYSKNVDSPLCSIRLQRYDKKLDCFLYFFVAVCCYCSDNYYFDKKMQKSECNSG
jgi:hypothetical protein